MSTEPQKPSASGNPWSAVLGVLPDVGYDVLARVVPGATAIALYASASTSWPPSGGVIAFYIPAGYVVGVFLDVISEIGVREIWPRLRCYFAGCSRDTSNRKCCLIKRFPGWRSQSEYGQNPFDDDLWGKIRNLDAANKALCIKMMAEKAIFRSFALLFLVTAVVPPPLHSQIALMPEYEQLHTWTHGSGRIVLCVVAIFFSIVCHWAMGQWVRFFVNAIQQKEQAANGKPAEASGGTANKTPS
jgi:hypothetical protein